jgi:hypothetical protein
MSKDIQKSRLGPIVAASIILVFVAAYMTTGYLTLDQASRAVPLLAGMVTVGLLCVELFKRARPGGATGTSRRTHGAQQNRPAGGTATEWQVLLSILLLVAGIYFTGFLVTIPLYLIGTITLLGGKPLRVAVVTAVLTTVAIYGAFEVLLSYRLFPGVLF